MKNRILAFFILLTIGITVVLFWDYQKGGSSVIFDDGKTTIGILPFEDFPKRDIDSVKNALENYYHFDVVILEKVDLPQMAYTEIRYPRYRADSLLDWMSVRDYDTIDIVLGLTTKDISITKYKDASRTKIKEPEWKYKDFGIFGLGRIKGEVCVVSSNRLSTGVSKEIFYKRLTRIACHEVGHVLALHHCPNKNCLMNDANESISTIDNNNGELCTDCKKEIE